MTRVYVHPCAYYCDGPRCTAYVIGVNVELPKGWREEDRSEGRAKAADSDYVLHLCPKCQAPETTR